MESRKVVIYGRNKGRRPFSDLSQEIYNKCNLNERITYLVVPKDSFPTSYSFLRLLLSGGLELTSTMDKRLGFNPDVSYYFRVRRMCRVIYVVSLNLIDTGKRREIKDVDLSH